MAAPIEFVEKQRIARRTSVLGAGFVVAFVVYGGLLWYTMVVQADFYRTLAASNALRTEPVPAYRGLIVDRKERILVRNRLSFDVVLDRERLGRGAAPLAFLARTLGLTERALSERLEAARGRPRHEPVILGEDVSLSEAATVEARQLEYPELRVEVSSRRDYAESGLAAHVLGYVGEVSDAELASGRFDARLAPGAIVGKAGVERVYEAELQGEQGLRQVIVNARGRIIEEVGVDREPVHGHDLRLTLDLDLQRSLEEALEGQVGAAVFLDPWSGEVLAMASAPRFEPNLFQRRFAPEAWRALVADPRKPLQNRAALSRFSPGSTFKLAVAAAGLEEGVITGSTIIHCGGAASFYGRTFRCHKAGGHGAVDLESAIVHSCNVYFYTVGQRLGIERIAAYARRLGLGEPTGIDLGGEEEGLVPTPEWKQRVRHEPWYAGETISVSIGQGPLGTTPLQMARLAAALANGGRHVTPHLRWRGAQGEAELAAQARAEAGFSNATIQALRRAMSGVVSYGTGTKASLPGIAVAAKTGTAQYSSRSAGVDADQLPYDIRDHAWFVGFAPADEPRIAFAVFIEHGGHGGTTAAPVARRVLETFFGIVPEIPAPVGVKHARAT